MEIFFAALSGVYVARDSYDFRDELKEAGFRYDGDARRWFTHSRRSVLAL